MCVLLRGQLGARGSTQKIYFVVSLVYYSIVVLQVLNNDVPGIYTPWRGDGVLYF